MGAARTKVAGVDNVRLSALDTHNVERALGAWRAGFPRPLIDLTALRTFDPFGVLLLLVEGRRCAEAGGRLRVLLPEDRVVREALGATDPFGLLDGAVWLDGELPAPKGELLSTVVRAEEEQGVRALVDDLVMRLRSRFPLAESSVRLLAMAMLELFQNIPQHANPRGAVFDPFGLGALNECCDHIQLAVADRGVGLLGSLVGSGSVRALDHVGALEAVLLDGVSRFSSPGRGGALRRIRELVVREGGQFLVRSGRGRFLQREAEWSMGEVIPLPGVQVAVGLPRAMFAG